MRIFFFFYMEVDLVRAAEAGDLCVKDFGHETSAEVFTHKLEGLSAAMLPWYISQKKCKNQKQLTI